MLDEWLGLDALVDGADVGVFGRAARGDDPRRALVMRVRRDVCAA